MAPTLQPAHDPSLMIGDVIKPYLTADGTHFASDFWMQGSMGAMAGALVKDYEQMLVTLGAGGFFGTGADGRKPPHLFVVGPDDPDKLPNEVMTSPGTPDCGWEPRGEFYRYDNEYPPSTNLAAWFAAGAPKWNSYGEWANAGLPLAYVQETWKHPLDRNLDQPGWPGAGGRRRRR